MNYIIRRTQAGTTTYLSVDMERPQWKEDMAEATQYPYEQAHHLVSDLTEHPNPSTPPTQFDMLLFTTTAAAVCGDEYATTHSHST